MGGLREHIEGLDADEPIAGLGQLLQIPGQDRWNARQVQEVPWPMTSDGAQDRRRTAGARGVEDQASVIRR